MSSVDQGVRTTSRSEELLLLRELTHRINNEYASIIGVVSLAAKRSNHQEVRDALAAVLAYLHYHAQVHRILEIPQRFTHVDGSAYLRELVTRTDEPRVRASFIRQVENCPAGRLVAWDKKTQKPLEPKLPISIGLVENPAEQCSGPLWLRGGIAVISADGFGYEVRNRTTLCRCGASQNKPFCDGSHASITFQAE